MTVRTTTTANWAVTHGPGAHLSRSRMITLAYHYQDLARLYPDDARFWLSRALYFGRLSWHRPVETRPDARNSRRGRPVTWRRLGGR